MKQPNTVSVDSTEEGLDSLFPTPDNEYVGGWYKLEEDEALVMEGRAPECVTGRCNCAVAGSSRAIL